jgi:hypothetical protein
MTRLSSDNLDVLTALASFGSIATICPRIGFRTSTGLPAMLTQRTALRALIVAAMFVLTGCASIMSGRHADVTFYSSTPGTVVTIRDKHGKEVASALAPSTIALKRKSGIIFPAKYTATFGAPGYEPAEVPIGSRVNPWVLGNVGFLHGGLIGLAVDNVTGAAWTPKESTIYRELTPIQTAQQPLPSSTEKPAGPKSLY